MKKVTVSKLDGEKGRVYYQVARGKKILYQTGSVRPGAAKEKQMQMNTEGMALVFNQVARLPKSMRIHIADKIMESEGRQ